MRESTPVIVAAVFLIMLSLVHLARFFCPFSIMVGHMEIPIWVNAIGYLFCGILGGFLLRSLGRYDYYDQV